MVAMRKVSTVETVEAIIGQPSPMVVLKAAGTLDAGCQRVLAYSPIAGLGLRDRDGVPHSTFVGGFPGFARVESPTCLSFEQPVDSPPLVSGGHASMLFLLPGIGETLRLNGSVVDASGARATIDLDETWVHCARCILRSRLWEEVPRGSAPREIDPRSRQARRTHGPLSQRPVADLLASSPFLIVSSWDGRGSGDTSPKGDAPGFACVLDGHTLAIPDRRGNKRADTFHNLVSCDEISLAALVPGCDQVLHMSGSGFMTDDLALLATMTLGNKPPAAALVVHVERAEIKLNRAVRMSRMWDVATHADQRNAPDLMEVAVHHLVRNKERGATAMMTRSMSRILAASPGIVRRVIDRGYRKELDDEGYAPRARQERVSITSRSTASPPPRSPPS
jgi:predicted pyridoxine 5'-phosphate oxidase superfamily flavin-nucleotide-binding protein